MNKQKIIPLQRMCTSNLVKVFIKLFLEMQNDELIESDIDVLPLALELIMQLRNMRLYRRETTRSEK